MAIAAGVSGASVVMRMSAGVGSAVLAHRLCEQGAARVLAITFVGYAFASMKEVPLATAMGARLQLRYGMFFHRLTDITPIKSLITSSDAAEGVQVALACAWAASAKADYVAAHAHGVKMSESGMLPSAFTSIWGVPFLPLVMLRPFADAENVVEGARLGVPFALTWSCHLAGNTHCGVCSGCLRRRLAFATASVVDPVGWA